MLQKPLIQCCMCSLWYIYTLVYTVWYNVCTAFSDVPEYLIYTMGTELRSMHLNPNITSQPWQAITGKNLHHWKTFLIYTRCLGMQQSVGMNTGKTFVLQPCHYYFLFVMKWYPHSFATIPLLLIICNKMITWTHWLISNKKKERQKKDGVDAVSNMNIIMMLHIFHNV